MRGGRQTPRHPRLHPWTESTSASASVSAATLAQSATARPTGWVCKQRGGSTTPPSAPATLPPLPLSPSQGSCHHGRLGAAAVTTALSAAGVSSAYVVAKAAPVSATLQLGGDFLLSVSRCTRTRATDGSVPVATLRYIVDCRRRDPPRLRRRNLLLLLRLRLRPAVSHAGALFRLVLRPPVTGTQTAVCPQNVLVLVLVIQTASTITRTRLGNTVVR